MSRFIKNLVPVPDKVNVVMDGGMVQMKGPKGEVKRCLNDSRVIIEKEDAGLRVRVTKREKESLSLAGTYWRVLFGMVKGVHEGAEKKLNLVGVGYRAQVKGDAVVLQLGFSHPIEYRLPDGVSAEAASQTEIIIKGADVERVGQVAADIRSYRPPEPYKGKGVRYHDERVIIKETKKK